jgi:hypothetical protein
MVILWFAKQHCTISASTAQLLVLLLTAALQFALGRRQAATAGNAQAGAPTAAHSTAAVPSSSSPASTGSAPQLGSSSSSSSSAAAHMHLAGMPPAAAGTAAATAAGAGVKPEAAGIHEGNIARVAAMSAAEVQDAQEELEGRFSPAALAFLKARAAKKQQQQQQQQGNVKQEVSAGASLSEGKAAGAAAAAGAGAPGIKKGFLAGKASAGSAGAPAAAAAAGAAVPRQQQAAAGIKKGFLSGSGARKTTQQQQQQQQSKTLSVVDAAKQSAAAHIVSQAQAAAAASATTPSFEPLPPVARLRFSLDGQVLELADAKTPPTPDAEVLLRDNMSRAAGVVPQGYSLPEMRVLMRSGHAPQRAAGFRMLAVVMRRAQPSVLHVGMDGQLQQQPVLLDEQQQQQQDADEPGATKQEQHCQQQQQQGTGVHWAQVWEYAVVALRAVLLCRLGLDDEHGQVLSAAADAAAVLLGLSPSEGLVEEVGVGVCSAAAGLSWPVSRRVSLRRLGKAGAWDRVQGLVAAAAAAQQQLPDEEVRGCILRSCVSVVAVAVATVGGSLLSAAVCMLSACCGVCWLVIYDQEMACSEDVGQGHGLGAKGWWQQQRQRSSTSSSHQMRRWGSTHNVQGVLWHHMPQRLCACS